MLQLQDISQVSQAKTKKGKQVECQVPSATVTGPIVEVYEFDGARRLVVALPNSAILVSLPVPRLADHLDTEIGPSDEEGGKEAKRQKSEPNTPTSTSSRLPYEYDEVMGITQMDPGEAERFEEGLDSEYHDAAEEPTDTNKPEPEHMPCFSHGGCGSSSLQECLDLLNQTRSNSPAPCHSGVKSGKSSDPLQEELLKPPTVG